MAEKIVSPGVFTRENDLSFLQQGVGAIGGAVIGPFKQGPSFVPQVINTQSEFEEKFGRVDGTFYTEQTVQSYLRESGVVTIVKVAGLDGYEQVEPFGVFIEDAGTGDRTFVASLHSTATGDEEIGFPNTTFNHIVSSSLFEISGSELGAALTASVLPSDPNDVNSVFGSSALGTKRAYSYAFLSDLAASAEDNLASGSYILQADNIPSQDFTYEYQPAATPWVTSQEIGGDRFPLFRFYTLGDGNSANRLFKISISNIRPAGTASGTDYATFTIAVRRFDDTDRRQSVLETYNNVTLDPSSPNYIARAIGDRDVSINADGKITEGGSFPNTSRFVRVDVSDENAFPISVMPVGHNAYYNPVTLDNSNEYPAAVYTTGSVDNVPGQSNRHSGIDLEGAFARDNRQYLKPIPGKIKEVGSNEEFGLDNIMDIADLSDTDATVRQDARAQAQFLVAFQGGFDGKSPAIVNAKGSDLDDNGISTGKGISAGNSQGFDLSGPNAEGARAYEQAINAISNQDEWDINLVVAPGVTRFHHPATFGQLVDLAEGRGDTFFIGDLVGPDESIVNVIQQASFVDSSYAGSYYPWVKTIDNNTNRQIPVPPSVLMPAIYAANDRIAAEWFAPAGLNRGGVVGAVAVLDRLSQADRDELYEGKVNPIASFPGQGIVAWGQKTLQDRPSALDRINVRRLLITAKKFVASTSRFLVFEQNTATTRNRFLNTVNPFFESIQQRQGLFAFRVVMDESNNTPDVVDRNILQGSIFIQPTRTAEFIVVDFNVLPTGATFDV